ncbi:MAG: DUF3237 domain-containing protein [Rhodospirillales bacterium]|jgi:hypothetical protein|nr:hypothetical protein [Rhodospirillaceae bacterium]MDP6427961.1 DUF3237 domain-containing protein [Rhodospirillales bacterium]MDP6645997.1 DUF3237 domain-containing protein [Rhodospirillales bacterium]MDP6841182.1 DUF3237 domain-containing protein [Rhodospirillales bacterium]|tara:strand:+ start:140 stop:592 length:453 start_codon:yes stop_codon:yes gene_type:complete
MIELELFFKASLGFGSVVDLGETPAGRRQIMTTDGGQIDSPRLTGVIHSGGADWQIQRQDGTSVLDVRFTIETTSGDLIYVQNAGFRYGSPEVMERIAKGEEVDPESYYFRTVPKFETASPTYDWVNRTIFVAKGIRWPNSAELVVYEVK